MYSLMLENSDSDIIDINDGINYQLLSAPDLANSSADIFLLQSPNRKGGKYNGSTLAEKFITFNIKLLGNVELNRNALYAWVDSEQYVKIHYRNGLKNVYCEGYIEKYKNDLFDDNQIAVVSVCCPSPFWKDLSDLVVDISNDEKQFTFPFAIEKEGIPLSTIKSNNETLLINKGSETGLIINIFCPSSISSITIYNANNQSEKFTIKHNFNISNFKIIIDSTGSPKTAFLEKSNGERENILKYITSDITWLTLKKGINLFGFVYTGGDVDPEVSFSYRNQYLGV